MIDTNFMPIFMFEIQILTRAKLMTFNGINQINGVP